MNSPRVSIITACHTFERIKDLGELLDSIGAQLYPNIETWLVSDGPDELYNTLEEYVQKKGYQDIQVLCHQGDSGISGSRNMAIRHATGEIIAFCDDDAVPVPEWAEQIVNTYNDDSFVIGVTGPVIPLWEQENMSWFPQEFYWIFSCTSGDITEKRKVRNGYGTNLSFLREAFELTGLLNEGLGVRKLVRGIWNRPGAEETEFSLRVQQKTGKHIIYNPDVKVAHKVYRYRLTMSFITHRAYWEGYAKALLSSSYRSSKGEDSILSTEYQLLRRILYKLIPKTVKLIARNPLLALRRLWITFVILSCIAAGYFSGWLSQFFGRKTL